MKPGTVEHEYWLRRAALDAVLDAIDAGVDWEEFRSDIEEAIELFGGSKPEEQGDRQADYCPHA